MLGVRVIAERKAEKLQEQTECTTKEEEISDEIIGRKLKRRLALLDLLLDLHLKDESFTLDDVAEEVDNFMFARPELQFQDITCEEVKSVESTFLLDTSYVRATREPEKKKGRIFLNFSKMYKNALKEDLIRVVENLDGTVESTDTIVKLKTKIENSSTFESDPDFVKTLIQNCIDERVSQNEREVTSEQKIELAKLQLAKLEKEIELQLAKNKALSLNPAAKVEEKQFETNIENMIKETATHIGIREAEDWFRPIDLAKECDIYISSRSGSHKEIPITYGYTQDPFKNRSQKL
ncbi:hypothetical protein TNCV_527811 [Trichonephila clavipes]|nr:hypothetical protein TNCV_527811 [Trichonephila clavipes]